ncbi:protein DOG1-like 4 [Phoenix dactylifera]|uniref:Protein DOG1-like 4 n=1 Tax=Phoenix dactylifera TaxID=42345 RepID=A0A8B7CTM0_PHODC|nr:protein DOG1-like 4 [Phoenix dactylifera]
MASQAAEQEIFAHFFDCWLGQLDRDLRALLAADEPSLDTRHHPHDDANDDEHQLRSLVEMVLGHYEYYYRAKLASARRDVLTIFSTAWASSTEKLFLWAGGWRPSAAFQLLYSELGRRIERCLVQGVLRVQDLTRLSALQLEQVDRLQRKTIKTERKISEEEAKAQELVAWPQMVEISHEITESGREVAAMEEGLVGAKEAMKRVLERADQLRMETIKGVVGILRPRQAVQFLAAAGKLLLRVHRFGKVVDAAAAAVADGVGYHRCPLVGEETTGSN